MGNFEYSRLYSVYPLNLRGFILGLKVTVKYIECTYMSSIQSYLSKIQSSLASGHATEHTYRPELRDLFSELTEFHIINEPK